MAPNRTLSAESIEHDMEALQEIRARWTNIGQAEVADNLANALIRMTDALKDKLLQNFKDRPRQRVLQVDS